MSRSVMYAKAFVDALERASGAEQGKVVDRFVEKIRADHVESLAKEILSAVQREIEDRQVRRTATVEVAREVSAQTFAKHGSPIVRENAAVVGGFVWQREGAVIDASIAGGLTQIRRAFIKE